MHGSPGRSRFGLKQRAVGLLLVVLFGPAIYLVWRSALAGGHYSPTAAALLPVVAIVGLGLALFPVDIDGMREEAKVFGDRFAPHVPLIWQYILLAAVLAGLGNWYALVLSL
jgi:hypothetical protein